MLVAFPPQLIDNCPAKVVSEAGLRQLHIAETGENMPTSLFS